MWDITDMTVAHVPAVNLLGKYRLYKIEFSSWNGDEAWGMFNSYVELFSGGQIR